MSARTYTTRAGDTWDGIAFRTLGAERYMDLLIEDNPEHNYVLIFGSGVAINLPDLPDPARPASLPPWRAA